MVTHKIEPATMPTTRPMRTLLKSSPNKTVKDRQVAAAGPYLERTERGGMGTVPR